MMSQGRRMSRQELQDREGYRKELRSLDTEELEERMLQNFPWYKREYDEKKANEEHYRKRVENNRRI